MTHTLTVRVTKPGEAAETFVHKVRNFAEDLHRDLDAHGYGSVPNMDTATDAVLVLINAKRHFGRVQSLTRSLLKRHFLAEVASLERGSTGGLPIVLGRDLLASSRTRICGAVRRPRAGDL